MDNRELIMECAKELFYVRGYDAVGVQEIVDRAGISKPTLYYYFGSKLGLLKTLLETKFADLVFLEEYGQESIKDIREELYRMAGMLRDFFEKDRKFYMLMMALFYSARENEAYQVVKPFLTKYYGVIVKIFENASSQLGNMNGRQRQFAIGYIGTINQYLLMHYEIDPGQEQFITDEQIISVVNQFMYGIFS